MKQSGPELYIGLMSGTSVDAVDAALVQFQPHFKILASHSMEIPVNLKQEILSLSLPGNNEIDRMAELDSKIATLFAATTNQLLQNSRISTDKVTAIGSHGQTIRHRPEAGFTLQLGDASRIAELTGITTVANFRQRDLAAGGQGAPLVPAFHQALFRQADCERIILNIGGIANITYLPARESARTTGFDTGPGNMLMDGWIHQHLQLEFDRDGNWASSGNCDTALLQQMLQQPYFLQAAPKSTGRELFNQTWLQQQLELHGTQLAPEDVQATLLQLTIHSIANAIQNTTKNPSYEVFVCGGGSHNRALMSGLQQRLPDNHVSTTEKLGLDPDWVEAAAFAWLAARCLDNQSGNLPEVTGASGPRILGAIHPA